MKKLTDTIVVAVLSAVLSVTSFQPVTAMPMITPHLPAEVGEKQLSTEVGHRYRRKGRHYHRHSRRHHRYRHRHKHRRHHHHNPWPYIIGGIIIGSIIANADRHHRWCRHRYRSYDQRSNTFKPYHGPRKPCLSPYYH